MTFRNKTSLIAASALLALCSCAGKTGSVSDSDTVVLMEEYDYEEASSYDPQSYDAADTREDPSDAARRYRDKLATLAADPGNTVLYTDDSTIWYSRRDKETGYDHRLYAYDTRTDTQRSVYLNKTSMEQDEFTIEDMEAKDGVVTIIMSEMRNSDGWVDGTYVWQYNCRTGAWKPLAQACSGAEFTGSRRQVTVNRAECLNPDAPTYLKEYNNHYTYIPL